MQREFLTIKEVHELTGLSIHTIRNKVAKGMYKTLPRKRNDKILIFRESVLGREYDGKD